MTRAERTIEAALALSPDAKAAAELLRARGLSKLHGIAALAEAFGSLPKDGEPAGALARDWRQSPPQSAEQPGQGASAS